MLGIDTNILVRFITQDDSFQTEKVNLLFSSEGKIFLSNLILMETVWVLEECYQWTKKEIILVFETLLKIENLMFEDQSSVIHAAETYKKGGDWSDHFIQTQCKKHHCTSLATFDRKFSQFYPDFVKLL